jgi:hypothetical protein
MATYNWVSAVNGSWTKGSKWSPYGGPAVDHSNGIESYSIDTAIFATGANHAYTVSGTAQAGTLSVIGDHVNFNNFHISNNFNGINFNVNGGASVVVGSSSFIDLSGNFYNADDGSLNVDHAKLTLKGLLHYGFGNIGPDAQFDITGGNAYFINQHDLVSGGSVAATGAVSITRGGILNATFTRMAGTVSISGQGSIWTSSAVSYQGEVSGTVIGSNDGTLAGSVTNSGTILAAAGTFHVTAAVSDDIVTPALKGSFKINTGATLDLGGNSDNDVIFLTKATLMLEKGITETGFLTGFAKGDKIDVAQQSVTSLTASGQNGHTILTAFSGSVAVETLNLAGNYSAANFSTKSDQNGGSLISYVPDHHVPAVSMVKLA